MKKRWFVGVAVVVLGALAYAAQSRNSPHEEARGTIAGKKVSVTYGRPFKKGREIFGGLVPFGEVWRTGADEATTITLEGDLTIGTLKVPKGTYGLFTLPGQKDWQLIVNKDAKQWGAFKYDAKEDLGRTPMTVTTSATPVEQFTISIEGNTLKLAWDKTVATVALSRDLRNIPIDLGYSPGASPACTLCAGWQLEAKALRCRASPDRHDAPEQSRRTWRFIDGAFRPPRGFPVNETAWAAGPGRALRCFRPTTANAALWAPWNQRQRTT